MSGIAHHPRRPFCPTAARLKMPRIRVSLPGNAGNAPSIPAREAAPAATASRAAAILGPAEIARRLRPGEPMALRAPRRGGGEGPRNYHKGLTLRQPTFNPAVFPYTWKRATG